MIRASRRPRASRSRHFKSQNGHNIHHNVWGPKRDRPFFGTYIVESLPIVWAPVAHFKLALSVQLPVNGRPRKATMGEGLCGRRARAEEANYDQRRSSGQEASSGEPPHHFAAADSSGSQTCEDKDQLPVFVIVDFLNQKNTQSKTCNYGWY